MLSRGASNASTRSKSSASANRRRNEPLVKDTIDPETARHDAMTAAQIAMDRASERASTEMRRSSELSRNQSNASGQGVGATPRSQNIRFTDPVELTESDPHYSRRLLLLHICQAVTRILSCRMLTGGSLSMNLASQTAMGPHLHPIANSERQSRC